MRGRLKWLRATRGCALPAEGSEVGGNNGVWLETDACVDWFMNLVSLRVALVLALVLAMVLALTLLVVFLLKNVLFCPIALPFAIEL